MALSPIYKKVRVDNQTATFVQIFTSMIVLLPLIMIDGNILTIVRLDAAAVSSTILWVYYIQVWPIPCSFPFMHI